MSKLNTDHIYDTFQNVPWIMDTVGSAHEAFNKERCRRLKSWYERFLLILLHIKNNPEMFTCQTEEGEETLRVLLMPVDEKGQGPLKLACNLVISRPLFTQWQAHAKSPTYKRDCFALFGAVLHVGEENVFDGKHEDSPMSFAKALVLRNLTEYTFIDFFGELPQKQRALPPPSS